jgi:hypothetical protein
MLRAKAGLVAKSAMVDPYTIVYFEGGRGKSLIDAHNKRGG